MIEVLDQPLLRGRHGVIIDPSFLAAADLATDLEAVLAAEGYSVGTGGQISTAVDPAAPTKRQQAGRVRLGRRHPEPHPRVGAHPRCAEGGDGGERRVHLRGAQHPGGGHAGDPGGHPHGRRQQPPAPRRPSRPHRHHRQRRGRLPRHRPHRRGREPQHAALPGLRQGVGGAPRSDRAVRQALPLRPHRVAHRRDHPLGRGGIRHRVPVPERHWRRRHRDEQHPGRPRRAGEGALDDPWAAPTPPAPSSTSSTRTTASFRCPTPPRALGRRTQGVRQLPSLR